MTVRPITIVGCANISLFVTMDRLPRAGESVTASGYRETGGGKGAHQAAAAARLGAPVRFVGRFGDEPRDRAARARLAEFGVDLGVAVVSPGCRPGIGITLVDAAGRNMVAVAPGTNHLLSHADIDVLEPVFRESSFAGFQLQNTPEGVWYGIRRASDWGCRVFLDPAPAVPIPDDVYPSIDIIKPNETEAALLTGIAVTDHATAEAAARAFTARGVGAAIVTLGGRGCVLADSDGIRRFPAFPVETVDTTGAGDVFSGGLLAALVLGSSMDDAVRFASAAAALSTRIATVQDAIPTAAEVRRFLDTSGESASR